MATTSLPQIADFRKRLLATGKVRPVHAAPGGLFPQPRGGFMPAFTTLPVDPVTGAIGRRTSGAPLYHRGSQFGPPERRKLDRNMRVRLLYLAIALDRRTRQKGQHGGMGKNSANRYSLECLNGFASCVPAPETRRFSAETRPGQRGR